MLTNTWLLSHPIFNTQSVHILNNKNLAFKLTDAITEALMSWSSNPKSSTPAVGVVASTDFVGPPGPAVIVTGLRALLYIDGAKVPENVVADRAVPLNVRLHLP